jgi:putative MFS transporter
MTPIARTPRDVEAARRIEARLDRLPASRHLWFLVALLALGAFFEAYELSLTSLVSPGLVKNGVFLREHGLLGLPDQAAFGAATFLGMFAGALLVGRYADRLGRKLAFTYALLVYTGATLLMAFQTQALWVDVWRFVAGIGLGAEIVTIDAYIAEIVPARLRGRAFSFAVCIQFLAVPVAGALSLVLVPYAPLGIEGWRWVCFIGCAGALLVWITRRSLPESPRWLAQRDAGSLARADLIVTGMERKCFGAETAAQLPPPVLEGTAPADEPPKDPAATRLFASAWRSRVVMMTIVQVLTTIGFYGFSNWLPTLLAAQGHTLVKSFEFTLYISLCYPLGPLLFMLFADRIERKWQIAGATLASAILGLAFGQQSSSLGLIVFGTAVTMANLLIAYGTHAYQSELFPSAIRAKAIGFVYSWGRLAAVFSSLIIGFLLQEAGTDAVFIFLAGTLVVVSVLVSLMGPKTLVRKGKAERLGAVAALRAEPHR